MHVSSQTTKINVKDSAPILIIQYSFISKIMVLFFRLFGVFLGFGFTFVDNNYVKVFGAIIFIFALFSFLINVFFKKLIFFENRIETEWIMFGWNFKKKLHYSVMEVMKSNSIFGGTIMFWEKQHRWKTAYFFVLDLLPVNQDIVEQIKMILKDKKVIKGDEYEWIR